MSDTASSIESTARVPRTGSYMFVMGRERGQGSTQCNFAFEMLI